ncbi:MAG: exo-alpha-sialidase, partial [Bacteroidales bacterium]|nr:exo-alpha-sialidase [Candidatus Sodaliphilus fimicaballi]
MLLICASSASAWDVYGDFASGNWWQEVGYAGVGNKNEVLAVAEVNPCPVSTSDVVVNANEVGTIPNNGTFQSYTVTNVTVNSIVDPKLTVQFRLKGVAADADYVGKVKLWARKYDANAQSSVSGSSQVANTFAYPFDYRDPVGKSGAILLYETSEIKNEVYTCDITEELTGNYVLYITADIKEIDTNPAAGMLPLLTEAKTELGAEFISIQSSAKSVDYTAIYDYTYSYTYWFSTRTGTVTDKTKTGTASNVSSSMTLAQVGKTGATNGSRVLVPQRKVLFTPGDFYSKYYRIPCLAKASDGSLIAISDARKYHIHDIANDIDMIARRSTDGGKTWSLPVTIAKGNGGSANMTFSKCNNSDGYGDAAIAALPNGDLIVTMIYGNGLGNQNGKATENYYCISHDNGQSWSTPKEINPSLTNSERGCIAPGNMCVVKEGYLAGKVIGCFRSYATSGGTLTQKNYFLVYDPATDAWSRLTINGSYTYQVNGTEDEAHLIEVGTNTFLYSVRQSNRAYARVAVTSPTSVTATAISSNISVGTACNGDMLEYTTKNIGTYQIHSLPVRTLGSAASGSGSGRNGLKLFYSQYTGEDNLSATMSTSISDPYDTSGQTISNGDSNNTYRAETAQYSSMTQLSDGSVGIFFEEYPQVIRVEEGSGHRGDFLMEDVYMNLRIGD